MRLEHCKVWATVVIATDRSPAAFARWLVSTLPAHPSPWYFSRNELARRQPGHEVANREAFDRYLADQGHYWFHTDTITISLGMRVNGREEVLLQAKSAQGAFCLLKDWIPGLDRQGLFYMAGCAPAESYHQNGVSITVIENPSATGKVWVGRDYSRYVPGLCWLNYFSRELIAAHRVDISRLQRHTLARVQELTCGLWVQMYESPEDWSSHAETIDDFLASSEGFFSKRRIQPLAPVRYREVSHLIRELATRWP